jgi:hypothetical protein
VTRLAGSKRVGHQSTSEPVEGGGKTYEVGLVAVGSEIDVLGVVAAAVRLDRSTADHDELETGTNQRISPVARQVRLPLADQVDSSG